MTKEQQLWASQHDWWQMNTKDGVFVESEGKTIFFDDIKKLKNWAGY